MYNGSDEFNTSMSSDTQIQIIPKELTVSDTTAANKVYDGNSMATISQENSVLVGILPGDTVTLDGTATGTFDSATIGTAKVVTLAGFTLAGASAGNYSLTQPTTTANITSKGNVIPLVVSPAAGESEVVIYKNTNQERARLRPMGTWTGGIRSAVADVTGDGLADFLFAAGPGGGPRIVVLDGVSLKPVSSFFAYASSFRGGVYISAGDLDGDGVSEIVTGAGANGGPHVKSFNAFGVRVNPGFFAYASTFKGGVTVATGDLNQDGKAEIITGTATNGGSHVRSFSANGTPGSLNFFAYSPYFMGGVNVGAGDLNGDGICEVITGMGYGGSLAKVFDAKANQLASINAFYSSFSGGITVAAIDPTNSGTFKMVVGPAKSAANYPGSAAVLYGLNNGQFLFSSQIVAYKTFAGGIWLA